MLTYEGVCGGCDPAGPHPGVSGLHPLDAEAALAGAGRHQPEAGVRALEAARGPPAAAHRRVPAAVREAVATRVTLADRYIADACNII